MKRDFSHVAIRWALIGGIVLCSPWIVSHSKSTSRNDDMQTPAFRIGEILNYRIDWQRYVGAATAQLQVVDRADFEGAPMWHFRATLHTAQPLRALYPVDDQIESYAAPGSFTSREYREHLREFGRVENTEAILTSPDDASLSGTRVIVPRGTHDVLSAIYFLRAADWASAQEIRTLVYDGQNVYQIFAESGAPSEIRIAAGTYRAREIQIRLFDQGKQVPDESFKLWFGDNRARTPLLGEASLPIGKLRIELVSDSAPETNRRAAASKATRPAGSSPPAGN